MGLRCNRRPGAARPLLASRTRALPRGSGDSATKRTGAFGQGEAHIHAECPIPARDRIKITLVAHCGPGWKDAVERCWDVGMVVRAA